MIAVLDRFYDKVSPEPNSGCHLWDASQNAEGYGRFYYDGRMWQAHRFIYEYTHGPIPKGFEPDHKCRVKCCVNLQHIEIVTKGENVRRALAAAGFRQSTHCIRGHPYTEDNTYVRRGGYKACKTCQSLWRM